MVNLGPYEGGNGLPSVKYHPVLFDRVLEVLAVLMMLAVWGCVIYLYNKVYAGDVPGQVWATAGIETLVWLLMVWASYAPSRHYRFPVRVSEQNIGAQYVLATRLCRVLNVVIGVSLFGRMLTEVHVRWAAWLFMGSLFAVALVMMGYFVLAHRYR